MSGYKDLFNINTLTDLETINVNEGTINSLTSDNFKSQSSEIDNGEFKTISVNNLNVTNDLNVKNIKLNSNSIISKGENVYSLQDRTGVIAHLDDIKMPENMVTTDTDQTITGKKTFSSETTINNYLNVDVLRLKAGSFIFDNMTIYKPLQGGGLVVWGDMIDYLTLKNVNQTVLGEKTFNSRVKFMNGFNNGLYNINMPNKSGVFFDLIFFFSNCKKFSNFIRKKFVKKFLN